MHTAHGRRIICLIAGMHRSGTSMMSSLVQALGYYGGTKDEEQLGPAHDNIRGYFEHREVVQINNALLEALGGSSAYPPSTLTEHPTTWWNDPNLKSFRQQAHDILQQLFRRNSRIVLKDPRFSLTLPLWYFPQYTYRLIVMARHPGAVARSLIQRGDAFTFSEALQLWDTYHRLLHAYIEQFGLEHVVIVYDQFVQAPFSWTVPLFRFLDVPVDFQGICTLFTQVMPPLQTIVGNQENTTTSNTSDHQQSNLPEPIQNRWTQLQQAMPAPEPLPSFALTSQDFQDLYSAVSASYQAVISYLQQAFRQERARTQALQQEIERMQAQLKALHERLQAIYQSRVYRLMRLIWRGTRRLHRQRRKNP